MYIYQTYITFIFLDMEYISRFCPRGGSISVNNNYWHRISIHFGGWTDFILLIDCLSWYCLSPCIKPTFYGEFRQHVAKLEEFN